MSTSLTLTGAIPGLLRRGSPVWWRDEETPYVVVLPLAWPTPGPVDGVVLAAPAQELCLGVQDDASNFTLDLTDPTGRFHALLWLRERGHDLFRWAVDEPEVLAWSVLSVARGGKPLSWLLPKWGPETRDDSDWNETRGQIACIGLEGWSIAFVGTSGPETGDAGKAAADAAALAAGYALRNDDGTLTLPPRPEVA